MASACRDVVPVWNFIAGYLAQMPPAWTRLCAEGAGRTLQLCRPAATLFTSQFPSRRPIVALFRYQIPP